MAIERKKSEIVNLLNGLKALEGKTVQIGYFPHSKYPSGVPMAYVATIHEFGAPSVGIPPRPFMRPTVAEQRDAWRKTLEKGAKAVLANRVTMEQVFSQFGELVAADIRQTITKITSPPLSMVTLLLRKRQSDPDFVLSGKEVQRARDDLNMIGPRPKGDKTLDVSGVSTKPLVWTGLMLQSLTYEVVDK